MFFDVDNSSVYVELPYSKTVFLINGGAGETGKLVIAKDLNHIQRTWRTCMCLHMCIYLFICLYMPIHKYMCVYVQIHLYTDRKCIHIDTYMHTCIHTYVRHIDSFTISVLAKQRQDTSLGLFDL